jgi:murein L,D-transpeptidase YafK
MTGMRKFLNACLIVAAVVAAALYFQPYLYHSAVDRAETALREVAPNQFGQPYKGPSVSLQDQLRAQQRSIGDPVFIRIFKETSELEVWMKRHTTWSLVRTYPICRWSGTLGPKMREGDGQSPEGFYVVTRNALNPNSKYHLAFNLGFPNAFDVSHGRTGSFLMVHGECVSIGCYAMTNAGITDIYSLVEAALLAGQQTVPVHVFPFRMTEENMMRFKESPHAPFWKNLKEGWDLFEAQGQPPNAQVCADGYQFDAAARADCQDIVGI